MTKYYKIITEKMGSIWEDIYTDKQQAIKAADAEYNSLSEYDKSNRAFYILETDDPDDLDGYIVKTYGEN